MRGEVATCSLTACSDRSRSTGRWMAHGRRCRSYGRWNEDADRFSTLRPSRPPYQQCLSLHAHPSVGNRIATSFNGTELGLRVSGSEQRHRQKLGGVALLLGGICQVPMFRRTISNLGSAGDGSCEGEKAKSVNVGCVLRPPGDAISSKQRRSHHRGHAITPCQPARVVARPRNSALFPPSSIARASSPKAAIGLEMACRTALESMFVLPQHNSEAQALGRAVTPNTDERTRGPCHC